MRISSSHDYAFDVAMVPEHIRKAFVTSVDRSLGKSALDGLHDANNKVRSRKAQQVVTIKNNEKNKSGESGFDIPTLEKFLLDHPKAAGFLTTVAGRKVSRPVYKRLKEMLEQEAQSCTTSELAAGVEANSAYHYVRNDILSDVRLPDSFKRHLPDKLPESFFIDSEHGHWKSLPKGVADALTAAGFSAEEASAVDRKFNVVRMHLGKQHSYQKLVQEAKDYAHINDMAYQVFRHPSYRALARIVSPETQASMMGWLNVIGMVTMVATIPLMYEGLKQWLQSLHQHQGSEPQ